MDNSSTEKVVITSNILEEDKACSICKTGIPTHVPDPCRCFLVCKACAMKMATGGRCKLCKEYYTGFFKIQA